MSISIIVYTLILVISILSLVIVFIRERISIQESFLLGSFPSMSLPSTPSTPSSSSSPSFSITDYIGPTYNYAKAIKTPKKLKVSDKPNLFVLPNDFKAVKHYVDTLVTGNPPLGNRFFVKSGTCSKDGSVSDCQGQDRWIYVDTISSGLVPCTNYKSNNKGLVPGVLEDVMYINPYEIFKAFSGIGTGYSTDCYLRTEKVGDKKKYKKETKCSVKSLEPECMPSF